MNGLQTTTTGVTENPPTITLLDAWISEKLFPRVQKTKSLEDEIYEFISKIENLIINFDRFPVSYNQMFLKGSLRYCWRALKRLNPSEHENLLNRTKDYVRSVMPLCEDMEAVYSYKVFSLTYAVEKKGVEREIGRQENNPLSRLNLESTEKDFNYIQKFCKKEKILPLLEKMTVREAMKD